MKCKNSRCNEFCLISGVSTQVTGDDEGESGCPVICTDREMHSLAQTRLPALRRQDLDMSAMRQHFYPEGGWGWIVCGAAFLAHLLTTGMQLAFGLLYIYTLQHLVGRGHTQQEKEAYAMGTGIP